ncbi:MAG: hypothetical protein R3Y04_08885 [Rikenellaceae bacterium]
MRRVEALNLNSILADLNLSCEMVGKNARINIIKTKLQLTKIADSFASHRQSVERECSGDSEIFQKLIEDYLLESVEMKFYKILEIDLDSLLSSNELKISSAELIYKYLIMECDGDSKSIDD